MAQDQIPAILELLSEHYNIIEFTTARDKGDEIKVIAKPDPRVIATVSKEIEEYAMGLKLASLPTFIQPAMDMIYFTEKTIRESELYQMKGVVPHGSTKIVAVDWGCFQTEDDIRETLTLLYAYMRHIEMIVIVSPTDVISEAFKAIRGSYVQVAATRMSKALMDAVELDFNVASSNTPRDALLNYQEANDTAVVPAKLHASGPGYVSHSGVSDQIASVTAKEGKDIGVSKTDAVTTMVMGDLSSTPMKLDDPKKPETSHPLAVCPATSSTPLSGDDSTPQDISLATASQTSPARSATDNDTNSSRDEGQGRLQKISLPITVSPFRTNIELLQFETETIHWTTVGTAIHDVMKEEDFWKDMSTQFHMEQVSGLKYMPKLPAITFCGMLTASVESENRTSLPDANRDLEQSLQPVAGIIEELKNPTYEHRGNADWSFAMHCFEHARG